MNDVIEKMRQPNGMILRDDIRKIIPYDDPFLFVTEVMELSEREIKARGSFGEAEQLTNSHFVGFPVLPAALVTEGFGQAGTIMMRYNLEDHLSKDILVYRIEDARFVWPAFPGDILTYHVRLKTMDSRAARLEGETFVGARKIGLYRIVMTILDRKTFRSGFTKPAID